MTEKEYEAERGKLKLHCHVRHSGLDKRFRDNCIQKWRNFILNHQDNGLPELRNSFHKLLWWCGERESFFLEGLGDES